jgi:hypothetical protein
MWPLSGLGAIGDLLLSMNKSVYQVGEKPIYLVTGAPPNAQIAWSSYRDGVETGEVNATYGHITDAEGKGQFEGGAFTEAQIGTWQKQIVTVPGYFSAQAFFQVVPAGSSAVDNAAGGLFGGSVNLFGFQIPTLALVAGAGIGLFVLTKK